MSSSALVGSISPPVRAYVAQLHTLVDQLLAPIAAVHADRLQCARGCTACCVDELTVFEVEADQLLAALGSDTGPASPEGACAWLDGSGACRAYAARPYVCRSQGLPLRWGAEAEAGPVEHRDICPLNEPGPPLESLSTDACWTLGPVEERLATAQRAAQTARGEPEDAPLRRVRLRDLLPAAPG